MLSQSPLTSMTSVSHCCPEGNTEDSLTDFQEGFLFLSCFPRNLVMLFLDARNVFLCIYLAPGL